MIALTIISLCIILGLLYAQKAHYEFIERQKPIDQALSTDGDIKKLMDEFDDYKQRVDTLTLRAGFKL